MHNAIMSHRKEVVTSYPSRKVLRKELIVWCDYDCYYQRRYALLNLTKLKSGANKKRTQFKKSILKKDLLIKLSDALSVRETLNNNNNALQKLFYWKDDNACA